MAKIISSHFEFALGAPEKRAQVCSVILRARIAGQQQHANQKNFLGSDHRLLTEKGGVKK